MLACYCLQGKQLASGVIGLLTCQSHYNVSGINRTPRASLLLRHPLAQRIPTCRCECCLIPLHWAVIMGRVSTEPGEKMPLRSIGYLQPIRTTVCDQGQLINSTFTGSRRKEGKNIFSIDKCLDRVSLFF